MGTVKRLRRHLQPKLGDDDDHLLLLADRPENDLENPFAAFTIDRVAEALWRDHGEAIVREWVRHSPGSRPAFWWRYSAPEQRRALGPVVAMYPSWRPSYAFGLPQHPLVSVPDFETQHDLLARNGLLLKGERSPVREPRPAPGGVEFWQAYLP